MHARSRDTVGHVTLSLLFEHAQNKDDNPIMSFS